MQDYEELYRIASRATAQAMDILAQSHWKCEALRIQLESKEKAAARDEESPLEISQEASLGE